MARRPARYGYRPDGRPRDPWKSNEDARALGFRSTSDFRAERNQRRGLSRAASLGHARWGEPTARDLELARRSPRTAPLDVLRRAALANARAVLANRPRTILPHGQDVGYDDEAQKQRILGDDRETLVRKVSLTGDEWADLARNNVPGNRFHYH